LSNVNGKSSQPYEYGKYENEYKIAFTSTSVCAYDCVCVCVYVNVHVIAKLICLQLDVKFPIYTPYTYPEGSTGI